MMAGICGSVLLLLILPMLVDGNNHFRSKRSDSDERAAGTWIQMVNDVIDKRNSVLWGATGGENVENMYKKFKDLMDLTASLRTRVEILERGLKTKCNSDTAKKGDLGKKAEEAKITTADLEDDASLSSGQAVKPSNVNHQPMIKKCQRGPKGQKGAKGDAGPSLKAPEIVTKSQVKWLNEGDHIQLSCVAKGYPLPSLLLTNSSALKTNIRRDKDTIILTAHKSNATLSDAKTYRCRAKSVLGEVEVFFDVHLKIAPRITIRSKVTFGRVGASVELPICSVLAIPPAKITWSRAYGTLSKNVYFRDNNQVLGLRNAGFEDSGFYFCRAENRLGKAKASVQLIITNDEFRMSIVPPTIVFLDPAVNLTCAARGFPRPHITWFKEGLEMSNVSYFFPRKDETVACITVASTGNYSCVASSGGVIIKSHVTVTDTSFPSTILKQRDQLKSQLIKWLRETPKFSRRWKLCYSSNNNYSSYSFLSRCGHYNQTVIVVQIGHSIFGGYSDVAWKSDRYLRYNRYAASNQSFLYSLQKEGFKPLKLGVRAYMSHNAIYRSYRGSNFWFGSGPDFTLSSYQRKRFTSNLGNTYESPSGTCCAQNWFFDQRDYASNITRVDVLYADDLFA